MLVLSRIRLSWLLTLVVAMTAGTAIALTSLFTQTIPPVPVVEAILKPNCTTLTLTPTPNPVMRGDSGFVLGQCSLPPGARPAFNSTGAPGTVTPIFELPTVYTQLAIIQHIEGVSCNATSPGYLALVSGVFIQTMPEGLYDYCATFVDARSRNLPGFDVTWTQQPS